MTSISKICILRKQLMQLLDTKIHIQYNNTIKVKSTDEKSRTFIYFGAENNDKDLKFKVSDYGRISNYTNIFGKGYNPNQSEKDFTITKVKKTEPWTNLIEDLNSEHIDEPKEVRPVIEKV